MIGLILKNRFLVGLLAAVACGFLLPAPGATGGWLHPVITTKLAVVVIFLLQGMVLPFEAIRSGILNWRLHAFVQVFCFGAFPLITLGAVHLAGGALSEELQIGFVFLGVLPTTVSTAIVFTAMAGGNAAGALVNVTLSNILGVFLTPLWMSWYLEMRGEAVDAWPLIRQLTLMVLLPLLAGQLLRAPVRVHIERHKHQVNRINSGLVLFIVYASFAGSVESGVFLDHGWVSAGRSAAGAAILFAVVLAVTFGVLRFIRMPRSDGIAASFCATQKTLAAGVPMAKLIFAANPALGLILLPVMIYHPIQLFVGGIIVHGYALRGHEEA